MIRMEHGNLLDVSQGIVLHGCNALGLMGAGLAKQLRDRHPRVYADYRRQYEARGLTLGQVIFTDVSPRLLIASAITQQRVRRRPGEVVVDYEAIETSARTVARVAQRTGLQVHFPRIGCGLAGGEWEQVEQRLLAGLGEIDGILWLPASPATPCNP